MARLTHPRTLALHPAASVGRGHQLGVLDPFEHSESADFRETSEASGDVVG